MHRQCLRQFGYREHDSLRIKFDVIQQAGSNPFGLGQPSSKVVFQTGSLFSFQQNSAPSLSGRTYANLEINSATFSQSGSGAAMLSIDDLTVTAGTLNLGMTGAFNIKGNISVASGQTLNFNANTGTVSLNGSTTQTIGGAGALTFAGTQTVAINNASGISLAKDVTLSLLTLTSGNITTSGNTLIIASGGSVSRTSGYVIGNLKKTAPSGSFTFHVGTANGYTPLALANASGGGDLTVAANTPQQPVLASGTSLHEYWTLTKAGTLTTDLTFTYLQGDVNGNEANYRIIVVESGNATSFPADAAHSVNTSANTFTVLGQTTFSDWTVGEPSAPTAVKLTGLPPRATATR